MSKKAITIIAGGESYSNLATFDSIEELNKTVRYYKEKFHTKLTKSTLLVLDQLHRYSCVYLGVSFRTKNNIAKSLDISRKTVQRACRVLEDLAIIKQLETKRKSDMRQSSNVIQILPIEEDVQQEQENKVENCPTKKTTPSLTKNIKDIRTEYVDQFEKYASIFFHDHKTISELKKIAIIHSRINSICEKTAKSLSLECLKVLIAKLKSKPISNVCGYFNGVCRKRMRSARIKHLWEECWNTLNPIN
ncbi:helix-turn-helix domain-containing protein [Rossellomorea sp. DA94]|uniref:helix-turn-helix domain-containing protein n=1 Tax=Rossellomorea sp. DA94 TaxID=3038653 RepID=UPI00244984D2|nr:helix-turn-helix domain-containing protein [Rossellomorea sp. DA94]WGG47656.1 helix-turn-helix domain-containing protein [Rossellomorea sp. DA94]